MKKHPAEAFLIDTREQRARELPSMPAMESVDPELLRSVHDLHRLAVQALEALPMSEEGKASIREDLRRLRDAGNREQLLARLVVYVGEQR